MKVEIGQEWKYKDGTCFVVTLINGGWAFGYGKVSCSNIPYLWLATSGSVYYVDNWTYLGTPVICEDCKKFCKQRCDKYKRLI